MKNFLQKGLLSLLFVTGATLSSYAQIPVFSDDFESGGLSQGGWTQVPASSATPWGVGSSNTGNVTPHGGSYMAKIYSDNYQDPVRLITPMLNIAGLAEPVLEYYIASRKFLAGTRDTLRVYYRTSTTGNWIMMPAASYLQQTDIWELKHVRLKDYVSNPTTMQIAFEWHYANAKGISLDDVKVFGIPQCFTPVGLRAINLTSTTAELQWTGSMSTVINHIKVSTTPLANPETAPADFSFSPSISPLSVQGLIPYTKYYWYIRTDCGVSDASEWSAQQMFETRCPDIIPPSTPEGFETNLVSNFTECWTRNITASGDWNTPDLTSANPPVLPNNYLPTVVTGTPHVGTRSLRLTTRYSAAVSGSSDTRARTLAATVTTPPFSVALNQYQVTFWLRSTTLTSRIHIGVMTDPDQTATFQTARTLSVEKINTWEQYTIYLNNITNSGKYVAFMVNSADVSADETFFIDDVLVEPLTTCCKPMFLSVDNVATTTALISWYGVNTSHEAWIYSYPADPNSDAPDITLSPLSNPASLTGLSPSTQYYVFVRSNCANGLHGEWSPVVTFKTRQVPMDPPLIETFESTIKWDLLGENQSNYWVVGTSTKKAGSRSLYVTGNGQTNAYSKTNTSYSYAIRKLNLTGGKTYEYWFDWKAKGEDLLDYAVAYLIPDDETPVAGSSYGMVGNNNTPPNSWISLSGELSGGENWQEHYGKVPVPSTGVYNLTFFWKNNNTGGVDPPAAIDNLTFRELTCPMPSNLIVPSGAITLDGATVAWTAGANETSWLLWIVPAGSDTTHVAPIYVSPSPTYAFTGLGINESYDVYVVADCGGTNGVSRPISTTFTTKSPRGTIPFYDTFEQDNLWVLVNGTQVNKWVRGTATHYGAGNYSLYISNNGAANTYTTSATSAVYAYKTFEFEAGEKYIFEFRWKSAGETNFDIVRAFVVADYIVPIAGNTFGMSDNNNTVPAPWIALSDPLSVSNGQWVNLKYELRMPYGGDCKFVLFWKNNASNGSNPPAAIDNVSIIKVLCPPVEVVISNIVRDGAIVDWNSNPADSTTYTLKVFDAKQQNPDQPIGSPVVNVTGIPGGPYDLSGLLIPGTTYYVYIMADCGANGKSDYTETVFHTPCDPLPTPYAQSFATLGGSSPGAYGADVMPPCWTSAIYKSSSAVVTGAPCVISGNAEDGDARALRLDSYYEGTAGLFAASYVSLPEFSTPIGSLELSFWARANVANSKFIVGTIDDPEDPSTFTGIREYSASTGYNYIYRVNFEGYSGADKYMAIEASGDKTQSTYILYVDNVTVGPPVNECFAPTSLSAGNVMDDQASIYWASPYIGPKDCEFVISTENVANINTTPLNPALIVWSSTLSNVIDSIRVPSGYLALNTTYYVYMRILCDPTNPSPWWYTSSSAATFKTTCAERDKCEYMLALHDAAGNGWSGNKIIVSLNSVVVGEYTVASGNSATYTIRLCPGTVTFRYSNAGTAPGENYFEVTKNDDDVIWSKQDNGQAPSTATFTHVAESCYDPCPRPNNLTVSLTGTTPITATATWTGPTAAVSYTVKVFEYTSTLNPETDTPLFPASTVLAPATSYTISSGLTSNTRYTVLVWTNCADGVISTTYRSATFRTPRVSATLPLIVDFEDEIENKQWALAGNAGLNKWTIGDKVQKDGAKSLYISDNNSTHRYTTTSTSYAYAFRQLNLAGSVEYSLSFDWRANGERTYDLLRVFIIPTHVDIDVETGNEYGMSGNINTTPSGWVDLTGMLSLQNGWQHKDTAFTLTASGTYNLAFFWKNNGSGGAQQPAAVDNIKLDELASMTVTGTTCLGSNYIDPNGLFDIPASSLTYAGVFSFTKYTYIDSEYTKVTLVLTVEPGRMNRITNTVCKGDTVDFYNRKLVSTGVYRHYTESLVSLVCDSVIELSLNVIDAALIIKDISFCQSELPQTVGSRTFGRGYPEGYYYIADTLTSTTNGCDSINSTLVYISAACTDNSVIEQRTFTIIPNPVLVGSYVILDAEFTAEEREGLRVEVITLNGSVIRDVRPKDNPITLDGFTTPGVYVIQLTTGTGEVMYGKLIVQ
ncbi:MAG: fibronectin type III domain-containing protein [Prevotellaceae bacterium]|jgi:hypothetical protein|nr:fibronectin type III domain-containing protein [Prevotellaceae bacterium]